MSLLNPLANVDVDKLFDSKDSPTTVYNKEVDLLKKSGIIKTTDGIEGHFLELMREVGLDSKSILARIGMIMDSGESDAVKLQAAKLALALHMHPGIVPKKTSEEKVNPSINFVIQTAPGAQTQVNLGNVLVPGGQKADSW